MTTRPLPLAALLALTPASPTQAQERPPAPALALTPPEPLTGAASAEPLDPPVASVPSKGAGVLAVPTRGLSLLAVPLLQLEAAVRIERATGRTSPAPEGAGEPAAAGP